MNSPPMVTGAGRLRVHAACAVAVYVLAALHHRNAAMFADLPSDAVLALDRAAAIARFEALPFVGNPVGTAWFGAAEDYLLAPFLVGVGRLDALLGRAALFNAVLAPLGYALGAALARPVLGLAWGGLWATLPAIVALSRDYPVNYRTTHWVLAGLVCAVWIGRASERSGRRTLWTWSLLLFGALAMSSHPLGMGALPAALVVALGWGRFRPETGSAPWERWLLGVLVVATIAVSASYLGSNARPFADLLLNRSGDAHLSWGEGLRGSLAAVHWLPDAAVIPGSGGAWGLLLLGVVPALIVAQTRAAAAWIGLWIVASFVSFSVAGYSASPWHLTPLVHPALALGFVGWAAALAPTDTPSPARTVAHWALAIWLLTLWLPSASPRPQATASAAVPAFSKLTEAVIEQGRDLSGPFTYFEAHARCGMDWSPEATGLDLRLRTGGDFGVGSAAVPLLAVVERSPALDDLALPGLAGEITLANGVALQFYRAPEAGPWVERFRAGCTVGGRAQTPLDVPMVVGGPAAPRGFDACVLPAPCPSYGSGSP